MFFELEKSKKPQGIQFRLHSPVPTIDDTNAEQL